MVGAAADRRQARRAALHPNALRRRAFVRRAVARRHRPHDRPCGARRRTRSGWTPARGPSTSTSGCGSSCLTGPASVATALAGPGLWAVGDVTGKGAFTHVSLYQADIAVRDILGLGGPAADYHALPRVTFTDPEIGVVGSPRRRRPGGHRRAHRRSRSCPRRRAGWIHKAGNDGFIKLIEDAGPRRARGCDVGGTVGRRGARRARRRRARPD